MLLCLSASGYVDFVDILSIEVVLPKGDVPRLLVEGALPKRAVILTITTILLQVVVSSLSKRPASGEGWAGLGRRWCGWQLCGWRTKPLVDLIHEALDCFAIELGATIVGFERLATVDARDIAEDQAVSHVDRSRWRLSWRERSERLYSAL